MKGSQQKGSSLKGLAKGKNILNNGGNLAKCLTKINKCLHQIIIMHMFNVISKIIKPRFRYVLMEEIHMTKKT